MFFDELLETACSLLVKHGDHGLALSIGRSDLIWAAWEKKTEKSLNGVFLYALSICSEDPVCMRNKLFAPAKGIYSSCSGTKFSIAGLVLHISPVLDSFHWILLDFRIKSE